MVYREYSVTKKFEFSAAHVISTHPGKCSQLHGHNFELEITISGFMDVNKDLPMLIEFKELKEIVNRIIGNWDHGLLVHRKYEGLFNRTKNSDWDLCGNLFAGAVYFDFEPTAEHLAGYVHHQLNYSFASANLRDDEGTLFKVQKVIVRETDRSEVYVGR